METETEIMRTLEAPTALRLAMTYEGTSMSTLTDQSPSKRTSRNSTKAAEEREDLQPQVPALTKEDEKSWLQRNLLPILLILFAVVPVTLFIVIVFRSQLTIGSPATEQEALIRANERLLQMTQWTIGTVLTLGVALIGFNWIVSSRNHDRDREALRDHQEVLTRHSDIALERNRDLVSGLVDQNYNRAENVEQLNQLRNEMQTAQSSFQSFLNKHEAAWSMVGGLFVERLLERLNQSLDRREPLPLFLSRLDTARWQIHLLHDEKSKQQFIKDLERVLKRATTTDFIDLVMSQAELEELADSVNGMKEDFKSGVLDSHLDLLRERLLNQEA